MKRISPIEIYNLLPGTNCGECKESSCMAFATKLLNREANISLCAPIEKPEYKPKKEKLIEILSPPIKEVTIGTGEGAVAIGGKVVMYRHDLTFHNPTAFAIDVHDEMPEEALIDRIKFVQNFKVERIGKVLKLNLIAVRSVSNDPKKFANTIDIVLKNSNFPLILCSFDPTVLEAGLKLSSERRPLIYAATKENWEQVAGLAKKYKCPVAVFVPNNLDLLTSIASWLKERGVEDLVLDPGTLILGASLADTLDNFVMLRRAAIERGDKRIGYPLLGVPAVVGLIIQDPVETPLREATIAAILMNRYADALILHTTEIWALLGLMTIRQDIYSDPRIPSKVQPGVYTYGQPDERSPVLVTSNFALTYYTVVGDIESAKLNCHLLVLDTEGLSVETSVAGRKFTAEKLADLIKTSGIEKKVKHKKLIIPGFAARLKGDIEDATGWEIMVGPRDSSEIPSYLTKHWSS
ncbi:MAG: acetyl-CoA decarbonylase/synthase complex subunit gamma [Euryarchaeota archaeon]|nr:acetyl-CoA decarbonylase/synthase complex subunit gamma [Euryarchaeota archaeon]